MNQPRYNIYTLIHKGLRASLCQHLIDLGKLDDTDAAAVAHQLDLTANLLHCCRNHLLHENTFIHPVLHQLGDTPRQTIHDHFEHEIAIAGLHDKIFKIKQLQDHERAQALLDLYSVFSLFVGENFSHMRIEETFNAELLWKHLSDKEIQTIEQRIMDSLTPEENLLSLLMILPNITHTERCMFMQELQQTVPADVFNNTVAMLKPLLNTKDWLKLNHTLKLSQPKATAA
ncbi:hypothetical protein [Cellvibrio sp. UBA7661]|uniref:hypothetical protein n=1 Tax=Cellvibrio sp. UBA7661 TaxID=1946311 RepID=UPI002F35C7BC